MLRSAFLILSLSAFCAGAFAADQPGADHSPKSITWDEFQARCQDPRQFNDQIPPQNIVLYCTDVRHEYVPAQPADVPLSADHSLVASVGSDKWAVAIPPTVLPAAAATGTCGRYKLVEKTYTYQRDLSCNDVREIKGTIADYCSAAINGGKEQNPKGVQVRDMDGARSLIDTCAGVEHSEKGKGGGSNPKP